MTVSTFVNTYAYSVAHLTDNLLRSLKVIIILSGLDPSKMTSDWSILESGIKAWLSSRHLEALSLEIYAYRNSTRIPVGRWDFDIYYGSTSDSDGSFWVDTDAIKFAIKKCGIDPAGCSYRVIATTAPGHPAVTGWSSTSFLSTSGFEKHYIGTTISGGQIGSQAAYWRKT